MTEDDDDDEDLPDADESMESEHRYATNYGYMSDYYANFNTTDKQRSVRDVQPETKLRRHFEPCRKHTTLHYNQRSRCFFQTSRENRQELAINLQGPQPDQHVTSAPEAEDSQPEEEDADLSSEASQR